MRKIEVFLLLVALAVLFNLNIVYSASSGLGISLSIKDTSGPVINLTQPMNNSGDIDGNITFSYNVTDDSNISNCSLIINNKINLTNNSVTKNAINNFRLNNLSIGLYNWSINCTDNLNNTGESSKRIFTINFMTHFSRNTTNISSTSITNITNFILETNSGRINFSQDIDLSQSFDLDKYVNISSNRIEINSSALSTFNKSATLQLVGLTFSNPRILVDGSVCPSTVCNKISYSGGTLVFNVTHFTIYSSEETPSEPSAPSESSSAGGGGGGGGEGGGAPKKKVAIADFKLDRDILRVPARQGEKTVKSFVISNTGEIPLSFNIDLSELENFVSFPGGISKQNFELSSGKNTVVQLQFDFSDIEPGVHFKEIKVEAEGITKVIKVAMTVDSKEPLFDINVEVLSDYQKISAGDKVLAEITLYNLKGGVGKFDVAVDYYIKDLDGNNITVEQETLAVETRANFVRGLNTPTYIKPNSYVFHAQVKYGGFIGSSSDFFEVIEPKAEIRPSPTPSLISSLLFIWTNLGLVFFLFIMAIFVVIFALKVIEMLHHHKKQKTKTMKKEKKPISKDYIELKVPRSREEEIRKELKESEIQKLTRKLQLLRGSYEAGYITEGSYKKSKEKIQKQLDNL